MDVIGGGTRSGPAGIHPLAVVLSLIVAIGLIVIVMPIMLVLGLIGLALLALAWGWISLRFWFARARMPNGSLDGRRNVRVRIPGGDNSPPGPDTL